MLHGRLLDSGKGEKTALTEWRSDDRKHIFRDGRIFLKTTQQGQDVEVEISKSLSYGEELLLRLMAEMLEDLEK